MLKESTQILTRIAFVLYDSFHSRHPLHHSCHGKQREKHQPFHSQTTGATHCRTHTRDQWTQNFHDRYEVRWSQNGSASGQWKKTCSAVYSQPTITHVCQARHETHVIERQSIPSQSPSKRKLRVTEIICCWYPEPEKANSSADKPNWLQSWFDSATSSNARYSIFLDHEPRNDT